MSLNLNYSVCTVNTIIIPTYNECKCNILFYTALYIRNKKNLGYTLWHLSMHGSSNDGCGIFE